MANRIRGEVGFTCNGKDYIVVLSFNAMCALESKIGESFNSVVSAMADPAKSRLEHTRALLWAGLRRHHKDVTLEGAGDLIDAIGIPEALRVVGEAIAAAFPPVPEGAGPLGESAAIPAASTGTIN